MRIALAFSTPTTNLRATGGAAGDSPQTPRGCPFQAWSLGALLRVGAIIRAGLAEPQSPAARRSA
jgi:hypothetical protein